MAASVSFNAPASHSLATLSSLGLNLPQRAASPRGDKELQLQKRVKELEEELRSTKMENEKQVSYFNSNKDIDHHCSRSSYQRAMIAKFRERWERLKESAKKKKSARQSENSDLSVKERIDEEPEAEAAATNE